jgi:hypothetical protein
MNKPAKKVAIIQSNYIPWKGYFDVINAVDEFILYDDVQYTKRDWRNRNVIKMPIGLQWLSVPVDVKGKYFQRICDAHISETTWQKKHWGSIVAAYAKTPYFKEIKEILEPLYLSKNWNMLSEMNFEFLKAMCSYLGISSKITFSMDYGVDIEEKNERLIALCKKAEATSYLSGPAAKFYMDTSLFNKEGIDVDYCDYSNYREYNQLYGAFEHSVSMIDLLCHEGVSAKNYMKSFTDKNAILESFKAI